MGLSVSGSCAYVLEAPSPSSIACFLSVALERSIFAGSGRKRQNSFSGFSARHPQIFYQLDQLNEKPESHQHGDVNQVPLARYPGITDANRVDASPALSHFSSSLAEQAFCDLT